MKRTTLTEVADLKYLTPENSSFEKRGEFAGAKINGEEYKRVWLHRVFPFDMESEFISVQDGNGDEIGIIRNLDDFSEDEVSLLTVELERKYFTPKIKKIKTLKERRGFSYWVVETDIGEIELSLHDTYRSITRVGEDRAFITDVSGNRYEIESIEALDRRSHRKLELYL